MRTADVAAAPSAPPGRSRTENAPADPLGFPALLTKTKARTAPAEGHNKTDEHPGRGHGHAFGRLPREEREAAKVAAGVGNAPAPGTGSPTPPAPEAPVTTDPPATTSTNVPGTTVPEPTTAPDPAASGAVGGTAPDIADGSGTVAGGVPASVPGAPETTGTGADDLPVATPQVLSTTPAATATTTEGEPTEPQVAQPTAPAATQVAVDGVPVAGEEQAATPQPTAATEEPDAPTATTVPADTPDASSGDEEPAGEDADPAPTTGNGRPAGSGPVLPEAASDRARAAVAAAHDGEPGAAGRGKRAGGEAAPVTPPAAAAPTPAPVATVAPSAAPAPALAATLPATWTSRGLAQTVERLADLVHVATARGVARAKLQLHPQELGGIEVRLRQSAEGLVASITAQRADGLEAVTQAGAELRRSLEERGLTLARLDISLAADGHGDRGWHGAQDRSAFPGRSGGRGSRDTPDQLAGETVAVEPATVHTTPGAGVLVDVQA